MISAENKTINEILKLSKCITEGLGFTQKKQAELTVISKLRELLYSPQFFQVDLQQIEALNNRCFCNDSLSTENCNLTRIIWPLFQGVHKYLHANHEEKADCLEKIRSIIKNLKEKILISSDVFSDFLLIKPVYQIYDRELMELFFCHLPIPPHSLFTPDSIPQFLLEKQEGRAALLAAFHARNHEECAIEPKILLLQRHIRSKALSAEKMERIIQRYKISEEEAQLMIEDANRPYKPQGCSDELAEKILSTVKTEHKLYSSVTHLCSAQKIAGIFDGCLYGRENLIRLGVEFRPAALSGEDIENGDGNVICLGPDKIDDKCLKEGTVGIELDLDRIALCDNPALFFKQTDLGWGGPGKRVVAIKNKELIFTFFKTYHSVNDKIHMEFYEKKQDRDPTYISHVFKDSLISDNISQMDAILSLNFFRFLDNLTLLKNFSSASDNIEKDQSFIQEIYDDISKLDDDERKAFMLELGRQASLSSEFNVYGAYKIKLDSVLNFKIYAPHNQSPIDSISMTDLIDELNSNSFQSLCKIEKYIPQLFCSHQFQEYLRSKVHHPDALEKIDKLFVSALSSAANPNRQLLLDLQKIEDCLKYFSLESEVKTMEMFTKLPQEVKNAIYGELYLLLHPFRNDYWGCAEHAFYNLCGQVSSLSQRAQAVSNYLKSLS